MPTLIHALWSAIACAVLVLGGAWLGDRLIGWTLPGDPCHDLLMIVTVSYFSLVLMAGLLYLVEFTLTITRPYRRRMLPQRTSVHVLGSAALCFSVLTPFIVLHGPHSGVAYGERVAVTEALERTVTLKQALVVYWRAHGYFPANSKELPSTPPDQSASSAARRIEFDARGDITIEFGSPRYPHLDGQTLVLRPHLTADHPEWDCTGGGLPDQQRPPSCRRHTVCTLPLIFFGAGTAPTEQK